MMKHKMESDSMLLLHTSNAYEDGDYIVVDAFVLNRFTVNGKGQLYISFQDTVCVYSSIYCIVHIAITSACSLLGGYPTLLH